MADAAPFIWDAHSGFEAWPTTDLNQLAEWREAGVGFVSVNVGYDLQTMQDTVNAVGVFGPGHVGPENLHCFFQPAAPGGVVALYANGIPFVEDDYPAHLRQLQKDGLCRIDALQESNYMDSIERPGWLVLATRS